MICRPNIPKLPGACLGVRQFGVSVAAAAFPRPEAIRTAPLREVDWPSERSFDPRCKAKSKVRSVPVPAAWPFYPFFAPLFTVRSKYPTNKRMDRQHQTE